MQIGIIYRKGGLRRVMKQNISDRRREREFIMSKFTVILGVGLLAVALLMGCGEDNSILEGLADDGSREARLEESRIALDKGDYSKALGILLILRDKYPGDPTILQYLSNAYAGLAGLDMLNILSTIEELDEAGNSGNIDMIGLVLGDSRGLLTGEELDQKLEYLASSLDALNEIENKNTDQLAQGGILAVSHIALTLGDIILQVQDIDSIELTEAGIGDQFAGDADFGNSVSDETLDDLEQDVEMIAEAVTAIDSISTAENDLSEDFDQFKTEIDQNDDGDITVAELEGYINSL